jgi:hypothetical protein
LGSSVSSNCQFLKIIHSAEIKPGFSGGPLMQDGKVVGLTHQRNLNTGQGWAIPVEILYHFFEAPAGFPELPMHTQPLPNGLYRDFYKIPYEQDGLIVTKVDDFSAANGIIQNDDVILKVDDFQLDEQGCVKLPEYEAPVFYTHLINMHSLNETVKFEILRAGKKLTLNIPLTQRVEDSLAVPVDTHDESQDDYIHVSGMIIRRLTRTFIRSILNIDDPRHATAYSLLDSPKTHAKAKYFIISAVHETSLTQGLSEYTFSIIDKVNGKDIRNTYDLLMALTSNKTLFHHITTMDDDRIIVPANSGLDVELQRHFNITSNYSPRLFAKIERYENESKAPAAVVELGKRKAS